VLLMIGDGDIIRPEHAVEMFRLCGKDSQLAILPGTSHTEVMERTELLLNMILSFLDAPVSSVSEAMPVQ
jgi:pimeloyl-ACP methyl ester carboxylesterase